jgi:hypothetical protein
LMSSLLILGSIFKPSIWRQNTRRIKIFCVLWFIPYFNFIYFFTGPEDLSVYPPGATSPYKLPWKAGVSRFVAHKGIEALQVIVVFISMLGIL